MAATIHILHRKQHESTPEQVRICEKNKFDSRKKSLKYINWQRVVSCRVDVHNEQRAALQTEKNTSVIRVELCLLI
jgi:hypothetical protein